MFSQSMKKTAKYLIDNYGNSITLIENLQGDYDVDAGKYQVITVNHPAKGVLQQWDNSLIISGVVNMDDLNILCYNSDGVLPDKSWQIEYAGKIYSIITVMNVITTQDDFITYELQVRS